jgi:murein DD-endopeptidase MepM/ murein hydrolase activator NlpD
MKISLFIKSYTIKACSFFTITSLIIGIPLTASANFISDLFRGEQAQASEILAKDQVNASNSQTIHLLESSIDPDFKNTNESEDIVIVYNDSFIYNDGFFGEDIEVETSPISNNIKVYTVKEGDTLSEIAESFGISTNTIRWENNISGQTIKIGQKLNILPITGIKHIVKSGDTIGGIASKYEAEMEDVLIYNDISKENTIKQGDIIFVPNGIIKTTTVSKSGTSKSSGSVTTSNTKVQSGYYLRPVNGRVTSPYGPRKGRFHTGVDFAGVKGVTKVKASASGVVVKAISGCVEGRKSCGGGYGNYVDIVHSNGTTTRYAHLSKTSVSIGQNISQGEVIGILGNTGNSTGPHLHFEIINANGSKMKPSL